MSLVELANLGEFLGGLAVIISLVFVGYQIRQNTRSVRDHSELSLSYKFADLHGRVNENPDLARLFDDAMSDPEGLSNEDVSRFRWFMAEIFCVYDGAYHLYKRGQISEASWRVKISSAKAFLENPILKEWWESRMTPLSSEFFEYVNQYQPTSTDEYDYGPISRRHKSAT
jgi:hypothetical protein